MRKTNYSRTEKTRVVKKAALGLVILASMAVVLGVLSKIADLRRTEGRAEEASTEEESDILEIDGVRYQRKKDLMTYLFIGIDTPDEADIREDDKDNGDKDGQTEVNAGQSDVLQIVVLDRHAGCYTRLPINRETVTQIRSVDSEGTDLGMSEIQLEFAHDQGGGGEAGCEITAEAVSNLLYGQPIDKYCSLTMGAIKPLNHLAGGVTVTIEDDFSREDPTLIMGETVHLTDDQAQSYVHGRMNVGDGDNESRMRRQNEYLKGLKPIFLERCREDNSYALEIYDTLEPYMVTDMSRNDFIKLAARVVTMEEREPLQIEGTTKEGRFGFMEFTPDQKSLEKTVLQLFYDKMEGE